MNEYYKYNYKDYEIGFFEFNVRYKTLKLQILEVFSRRSDSKKQDIVFLKDRKNLVDGPEGGILLQQIMVVTGNKILLGLRKIWNCKRARTRLVAPCTTLAAHDAGQAKGHRTEPGERPASWRRGHPKPQGRRRVARGGGRVPVLRTEKRVGSYRRSGPFRSVPAPSLQRRPAARGSESCTRHRRVQNE